MEKPANTSKSRAEDLSGQTFGRLTAIRRVPAPEGSDGRVRWLCKCTCGNECVVLAVNLKSGHTTSCGCRKLRNDLAGQHIGMLTVLERSDKFATRGARRVQLWKCRCDCGNITYKATDTLTNPQENSCWPCACKRNAANAIKSAGFEDGTQTYKIIYDEPSVPHDGKCRGVYYDKKRNLYEATITFRRQRIRLGHFRKFEDAVKARQVAEDEIFGGFWRQKKAREEAERAAAAAENTENEANKAETAACAEERGPDPEARENGDLALRLNSAKSSTIA